LGSRSLAATSKSKRLIGSGPVLIKTSSRRRYQRLNPPAIIVAAGETGLFVRNHKLSPASSRLLIVLTQHISAPLFIPITRASVSLPPFLTIANFSRR
jgi:hypothetical protein